MISDNTTQKSTVNICAISCNSRISSWTRCACCIHRVINIFVKCTERCTRWLLGLSRMSAASSSDRKRNTRLEVLTAVLLKIQVFLDAMLCRWGQKYPTYRTIVLSSSSASRCQRRIILELSVTSHSSQKILFLKLKLFCLTHWGLGFEIV